MQNSKKTIHYECKYTPVELIQALGGQPELMNSMGESFPKADILGSPNLCGFGKTVIETAVSGNIKDLFLVNCCDTITSAGDIIRDAGTTNFLYTMDLPHCQSACSRELLTARLEDFAARYIQHTGAVFDGEKFRQAFAPAEVPGGPYIAVIGARMGDQLFDMVKDVMPLPARNLTCVSGRDLGHSVPPETQDFHQLMDWYAGQLLAQTPCMRMEDISGRKSLFNDPDLAGIIYHTIKFCDFYSFEYSRIKDEAGVPLLKLESDFTLQSSGQVLTRLEAFGETIRSSRRAGSSGNQQPKTGINSGINSEIHEPLYEGLDGEFAGGFDGEFAGEPAGRNKEGTRYYAGIDSGSTSTDVVIMDQSGKIITSVILPTGAGAENSAARGLTQALAQAGLEESDLAGVTATGYGRGSINVGDSQVTEISCHARGAHYLFPEVRTVIDIGGQDSKVICLDAGGNVKNFVMNDKCAAGTGRFLDNMARTLEMTLDQMSKRGINYKEDITISSMCTVFAESEVVSLIAKNKSADDIVHGLNKAVASKTGTLVARAGGTEKYMMTGGVSRNAGLVRALEKELGAKLFISPYAQLCGAIGAALFAMEE
ncbi:acyl-CoA dehydratase activase [Baileyella intestinalis]|uniref:acyl-CoA dehydratase activase n=1 Tax=Baileyella intestinalis TaxID=2606709 RepID=UPI0022E528FE|nr:acyl-CoA dehydratase activase [Baileyella intestinalis]